MNNGERIPDVVTTFFEEFESDSENESSNMIHFYDHATDEQKNGFDNALLYLCGWSLRSLKDLAKKRGYFVGE